MSGLLGNYGQPAYSAANAGLTGLVHHRRAKGLPATVVHWGPWADAGIAATPAIRGSVRRRGAAYMKPELCLLGLERALEEDQGEWRSLTRLGSHVEIAGRPSPFLSELPEVQAARQCPTRKARRVIRTT